MCLFGCLSLLTPRIVLVLVALFSNYLERAYHTWLWPILGFFFAPLTTFAYAFAINSNGSVSGIYLVIVILAALLDVGALGHGEHTRRSRR